MKDFLDLIALLIKVGPRNLMNIIRNGEIDLLTETYNRRGLLCRARKEKERVKRGGGAFSFIFFDVDGLKTVNDKEGHTKGDEILRMVSYLIKKETRSIDVVSRWGGDEFVVLLPETICNEATVIAERIQKIAQKKHGRRILSFGVSNFCNGDDVSQIISEASKEMYKQRQGR